MRAFVLEDSRIDAECWDVGTLLPSSSRQSTRHCEYKEIPRMMQMGVGEGG